MANSDTIFERLIAKLLPTGRAWWLLPQKIMGAIFGGIADVLQDVRTEALKVKDSNIPQLMDVEFIPDWENRFNLPDADLTEQERRDRLEAQWQPGSPALQFLEQQLQAAGFDVYVITGSIIANGNVLGDGLTLGDFVLEGNVETGETVTRCTSVTPHPEAILGDMVLGDDIALSPSVKSDPCKDLAGDGLTLGDSDFTLGDDVTLGQQTTKMIVDHINPQYDPSSTCPISEAYCAFIFYIQGPGEFGDLANIPAARYSEFRELVLKHKAEHTWAAVFANLV
jgi:uncharacterized protein YmfQ (DUF2313 family)